MDGRPVRWLEALLVFLPAVMSCAVVFPNAASGQVLTLSERVAGADKVVVATARSVSPRWIENSHGDRLIVSRIALQVEETLKGSAADLVSLDLEGGTLDGVTLRVSSLPEFRAGERAVFFLNRSGSAVYVPHARGQGILKLDREDVVIGTSLRLDDIRRATQPAVR